MAAHRTEHTWAHLIEILLVLCIVSYPKSQHANSIMQNPNGEAKAPIPPETVINDSDMHRAVTNRCKAAKRNLPWDLNAGELLVSQDEDNSVRKNPRLEDPLPTTTDEAARKTASPDISEGLPPPAGDDDDANADAMTDTQPNAVATGSWTLEEDAKLTRALANTSKKRCGEEYKRYLVAISEIIPGQTRKQCLRRSKDAMNPRIGQASGRNRKWTAYEDIKLKDAVQTHGGKNWAAITALVPDRTKHQCLGRWRDVLDPNTGRPNGRTGQWSEDEDSKLKDAVHTHNDWVAITTLVPGRSRSQCRSRWKKLTAGRTGKWTADEDGKLQDAVRTHGGKDWAVICALVPGRTRNQCLSRWHAVLDPKPAERMVVGVIGQYSKTAS
jgi:hypothetical protein